MNKLAEPTRDASSQRLRSIGAEESPAGAFVFARAAAMTMLAGNLSLAAQGVKTLVCWRLRWRRRRSATNPTSKMTNGRQPVGEAYCSYVGF